MYISPDSHLDHNLTAQHIRFILDRFALHVGESAETVELPHWLPPLPCALYGPLMGDPDVDPNDVVYRQRGTRPWVSPIVIKPTRPTRLLSVVIGPDERWVGGLEMDRPTVLYTAFGGPLAPQEPGDPNCKDVAASEDFWLRHALSYEVAR